MKRIVLLLILMMCWLYALPPAIETIIKHFNIPKRNLSIYIEKIGSSNRMVASLNASVAHAPASTIKVLTIYAAILKLGFDYRWPTRFYATGTIKNGILDGDLIIKGFGDPTLSTDDLDDIVAQIKAKGIREIMGNIIIDRSYFKVGIKNSSCFDDNPNSPYNAMPDAMMFNERVSTICVVPNKNNVHKKDPDRSFIVHNQLQRINRPCRGRYSWPLVKVDSSKAVPEVWIKGKISKWCGSRNINKVVTRPYQSFYYILKEALHDAGVQVKGNMYLHKVPFGARTLFTHYSQSLEEIVSQTAKDSNNLYARHLLLLLCAKVYGAPATLQKGRKAVLHILRSYGVLRSNGKLKLDNGSGLSRTAKINANILTRVLEHAYRRYGMRWMKTLSIAGVDGTLEQRFQRTVAYKRAWMKTGTLKHVKNIAGYVKGRNGRYYIAVILANAKNKRQKERAEKLQNKIIEWLVTYKGKKAVARKRFSPRKETKHTQHYYIQVGFFNNAPSAKYLLRLENFGLPYNVDDNGAYRVLIGPYANEKKAYRILKRVKESINPHAFLFNRKE
ncbi:MAG: D-alanyl-D-alanine carboxypeptidase/D-alanyl-D-alanine-endopeptidase [Sulfurovum sp.]|nr:D-alanyl-D-alanine carboxypeptidase/D-alanyl-D-alanine-endopeptidase [Sulfurovum sp.]MCB4746266.1 D-alanyl-D-alanine carboxypeptidase/D-alanyl-D-alanine-endopeptidase [Sulfurovum sp.]MCB4749354.1 D-alanyl-D-alanine carboxypeptidase/D-alanyl-D-alanine-endopeptidase [Sulfurovum sp.]MCB4751104.1 D-alanyl-D-alanine carboxypeptidase/D-alanyl-D-alanine-endopeptidase [Sulfurovum sp.]MCB4759044.1 D-alanyl-D-alanine carboxypeptidase/D-alanyl-D-alanine-endopeptidase [Sulfurovum sp.]